MKKIYLNKEDLYKASNIPEASFEKYVPSILNYVNGIAQATRPKVVGKMTELMEKFRAESKDKELDAWERWYKKNYPHALNNAAEKIKAKLQEVKYALETIDEDTIRKWVQDLVIHKTYVGLVVQRAILQKLSKHTGMNMRYATAEEESQGIDGYIGSKSVSVKPSSYQQKQALSESIAAHTMIYYEKDQKGLFFEFEEVRFKD